MKKDKKHKEIDGKFVPLTLAMMRSEAWGRLSDRARVLWTEMTLEYIRLKYNPKKNEKEFAFNYGRVKERMSNKPFYKAIKELVDNGFFEVMRPGGLYHRCSLFKVSVKWKSISMQLKEEKDRATQSERDTARNESKKEVEEFEIDKIFEEQKE